MTHHSQDSQQLRRMFDELVDKAQQNQETLERFQQFELSMLSCGSIADLLSALIFGIADEFDLCDTRLILFDRSQELRPLMSASERKQFGHRLVFDFEADALEDIYSAELKPRLKSLSPNEKRRWFSGKSPVQSAAFVPLVASGELIGSLHLGSQDATRFGADMAVDFMTHTGMIAAMCVQNSVAKEQVRLLSMIDPLTQVKNRRCFDLDIKTEVSRALRNSHPLSCLFIDADLFKRINDVYGHQAGDETLLKLAQFTQTQLRDTDHIARFGGEEFAILLPDCDANLALRIAERVRLFVAGKRVRFDDVMIKITLSIGASTFFPNDPVDSRAILADGNLNREWVVRELIGQADAAVYDAKAAGRNRVCYREMAENLPAESYALQSIN